MQMVKLVLEHTLIPQSALSYIPWFIVLLGRNQSPGFQSLKGWKEDARTLGTCCPLDLAQPWLEDLNFVAARPSLSSALPLQPFLTFQKPSSIKGGKQVVVVQLLSHVQLFATPWTAAHQASVSFTISWSLLKLTSIELVMPSNHLILHCPLLLLPSIFPSIRVFSSELVLCIRWPKYWSFSFTICPSNE